MKNFAILDDNLFVINIVVAMDQPENGIEYTSDNPAFINGDYVDGYFYPPKPFPSWTRFEGNWIAPVQQPAEGYWLWDEESLSWING